MKDDKNNLEKDLTQRILTFEERQTLANNLNSIERERELQKSYSASTLLALILGYLIAGYIGVALELERGITIGLMVFVVIVLKLLLRKFFVD